jgi:hypothetical protein
MKHLKSYILFENVSNQDLELDVKDMLLELEDSGYQVDISMRPSGIDMFCVEVSNDNLFQWSDVREYFERAKDYICSNDWEITNIHIHFYGPYSSKIKEFMSLGGYNKFIDYVDNEEFINNNKIEGLSFIFDPVK